MSGSRRAVSPVIATVILIAVAVALGIAVAVWAGALTGGLQRQEKLVIYAYQWVKTGGGFGGPPSSTTYLNITITNQSPSTVTIIQILFNQQPLSSATAWSSSGFTAAVTKPPATLNSAATGYLAIPTADFTAKSGISYPVTLVTAAGNSYPVTIAWP